MGDGKMIHGGKESNRIPIKREVGPLVVGCSLDGSLQSLKELTKKYGFSVAAGDLQLLEGGGMLQTRACYRSPATSMRWN